MGHQACCVSACNYGQDGSSDVPQQKGVGANTAGIRGPNQSKSGSKSHDLFVMSAIGLTIEKLEEDYQS